MANEVKLQEGQPVDDNLRPLKVGGESTSIELAKNGARINGDLELRGDAGGDTTAINCKKVIISENYSDTTAATITPLKIKFDKGSKNEDSRLVFQQFKGGTFEKEISRIDGIKNEYAFGDVTTNKI